MGEMADYWRDVGPHMKEHVRDKKYRMRVGARQFLEYNNVTIESSNNDIHMILTLNGVVADFWPGTSKFRLRAQPKNYRTGTPSNVLDAMKKQARFEAKKNMPVSGRGMP